MVFKIIFIIIFNVKLCVNNMIIIVIIIIIVFDSGYFVKFLRDC